MIHAPLLIKNTFQWLLLSLALTNSIALYGQEDKYNFNNETFKINWNDPEEIFVSEAKSVTYLSFERAVYNAPESYLPYYVIRRELTQGEVTGVELVNVVYESLSSEERRVALEGNYNISSTVAVSAKNLVARKKNWVNIALVPLRKNPGTGQLEKVVSFQVEASVQTNSSARSSRARSYKLNSVLRAGDWFKIGVHEDGIYKLTYNQLSELGMDVSSLNSNELRLFGNGGGMLPVDNSEERLDDINENAIQIVDGGDGVFNSGDYLLFYGQSQHRWDQSGSTYTYVQNFMADTTYYFVTRDYQVGTPKRVAVNNTLTTEPDLIVSTKDFHMVHEEDLVNFVTSGRRWFGEAFEGNNTSNTFSFSVPNINSSEPVSVKTAVAGRTFSTSSDFNVSLNGTSLYTITLSSVPNDYTATYAKISSKEESLIVNNDELEVALSFIRGTSVATGWLDYIELKGEQNLIFTGDQLLFRKKEVKNASVVRYNISGMSGSGINIWDVTDPVNVMNQEYTLNGSTGSFRALGGVLNEYVAFNTSELKSPQLFGSIDNQDLHALRDIDYVIVVHPKFKSSANALAAFHRRQYGYDVEVVTTNQVYNEFSSGAQDMTAIKDLMRMLYDRAGNDESKMPQYLLLFGDASYDLKHRISGNTNYVVSYQSVNSVDPTGSYVTDDYFGFLDNSESDEIESELDLGVGRLPVKSVSEAQAVVNKIIQYHALPDGLGAWRTWLSFVGDDEDGKIHMRDANRLATKIDTTSPEYNIQKIYFDAYPQETNSGGEAYPGVTDEINSRVDRGALFITYVGHGGELGWAHERVLGTSDIQKWDNIDNMPLFLTATCEFSRFDDPERTSAGEMVLLNSKGGGVALLTTTRLVYSTPNYELSNTFMDYVFDYDGSGTKPTLGDLLRECKTNSNINSNNGVNYRNFSLLGDPGMRLAYPTYNVVTTSMPDTIKALQEVTIKGYVENQSGQKMTSFNGVVYPTVFNSEKETETLDNDGQGVFTYKGFENVIFRGRASVTNGEFEFSFVVPKDVSIDYGIGRVSYYADNDQTDAIGYYEDFVVGGTDENAVEDNNGPEVQLWMNDETFVMGGITDENPLIYARVYDENGINTVGSGIGHDILATLNEESADAMVLNDYYESDLDSYKSGTIQYPLSDLDQGKYTLQLRVWDVYNNSAEAYTEFIVANSSDLAIEHLLNYPNPFTTNTSFYFEHNAPGQNLDVRVEIYTVSGKLVKVLDGIYGGDGYRVGPISWNGRDDFGDRIGRGTYIYRVKVSTPGGSSTEEFEKLVILN
ncbi:MAG: hypothetical protein CL843_01720 [Crocinitomicaceae bacterium]|nr:hypothetical protein [Crocinitomicaceae bacterium]